MEKQSKKQRSIKQRKVKQRRKTEIFFVTLKAKKQRKEESEITLTRFKLRGCMSCWIGWIYDVKLISSNGH